jgi:hypothetical protein
MLAFQPDVTVQPPIFCFKFPNKIIYLTMDEASVALREVSVYRMEQGERDPCLWAYPCCGHWHLGRRRARDKKIPYGVVP